jgi:hypothetical protein
MTTNNMLNTATVPIPVTSGGTNFATATTSYAPICTGTTATGTFQAASTGLGTPGFALTSNGSSSLPSFLSPGMGPIATVTASSVASVAFTGMTGYTNYMIFCNNITPATNNAALAVQFSNNGGSSYTSGGSDYRYNYFVGFGSTTAGLGNSSGSYIAVNSGMNSTAGTAGGMIIYIYNPSGSEYTSTWSESFYLDSGGDDTICSGGGQCTAITDVNAVKLLMTTGNITSGNFQLYGLK